MLWIIHGVNQTGKNDGRIQLFGIYEKIDDLIHRRKIYKRRPLTQEIDSNPD